MNIRKLIVEDVRCFAGRQEFNIRPLTFLVGENSTGKIHSALAVFKPYIVLRSARAYSSRLDFNVEPYQMGAFADIVRRSTPKKKSFTLGFELEPENRKERVRYFLDADGERERLRTYRPGTERFFSAQVRSCFVGQKQGA